MFVPHRSTADGLAILQCHAHVASSGSRCQNDARQGSLWCGKHATAPPARKRCQHVYDDGSLCRSKRRRPSAEVCNAHRTPCPGWDGTPCGTMRATVTPTLCRVCDRKSRHCIREVDDGQRCKVEGLPEGQTLCGNHSKDLPPAEGRCQVVYASGEQCHRARNRRAEVCQHHHARPCVRCDEPGVSRADAVCGTCRPPDYHQQLAEAGREPVHLEAGRKATPARSARPELSEADLKPDPADDLPEDGEPQASDTTHEERCRARAATTGNQCRNATDRAGLCRQHAALADLADRCSYVYDDGIPCLASRATVTGSRCKHHKVPCQRCGSDTTNADGLCRHHRPRCNQRRSRDGKQCQHAEGEVTAPLCGLHAAAAARPCQVTTTIGDPCSQPGKTTVGKNLVCLKHAMHLQHLDSADRCTHTFDNGQRCPSIGAPRQAGGRYRWCSTHWPTGGVTCRALRTDGEPCEAAAMLGDDGQPTAWCTSHQPAPVHLRCTAEVAEDERCPGSQYRGLPVCVAHQDQAPRCSWTALTTREQCSNRARDGSDGCRLHQTPDDPTDRCTHVEDGQRCRWRRTRTRQVCVQHAAHQPRCAAVIHDIGCRLFAAHPFDTCDKHAGWTPDTPDHDPEALMRFFLRPRADKLADLQQRQAQQQLRELQDVTTQQQGVSNDLGEQVSDLTTPIDEPDDLPDVLLELRDKDPYDLTGSRRRYRKMVADGVPPDKAARAVELVADGRATDTLRSYTTQLKPWLEWCKENLATPCPANENDVLLFLRWLAERGRLQDGEPLQASTFTKFQSALARLHAAMKQPNPFEKDPDLRMALRGYSRTYGRIQQQAHAIRAPEVLRMVKVALGEEVLTDKHLRDEAIVNVVADPEVGLGLKEASALLWEDILKWPDPGTGDGLTMVAGRGKQTEREVEVPNRSAGVDTSQVADGETPLAMRLCGVAALRSLHARLVANSRPATGPVFTKDDGTAMTNNAIRKVIRKGCKAALVAYDRTLTFDDRAQVLLALDEPDFLRLRDATILAVSWWASLRRAEVAALDVGSIGADARGRGSVVLVGQSKTDQEGTGRFVFVPHAVVDGRTLAFDLQTLLHRYLNAYARRLGRPLRDDDPLFIATTTEEQGRLSAKSVGAVVARYAEDAGVHAEIGEYLSHHGLRAGFATEALSGGMPAEEVARRQGRASTESLTGYYRLADQFTDCVAYVLDVDELGDIDDGFADVEDLLMQLDRTKNDT